MMCICIDAPVGVKAYLLSAFSFILPSYLYMRTIIACHGRLPKRTFKITDVFRSVYFS
jgi:hypothetical protein